MKPFTRLATDNRSVRASSDGSDRLGMGGRFVVAAVAAVDVTDRNRRELFGREIERGHGDGVERAAERVEVAPRVGGARDHRAPSSGIRTHRCRRAGESAAALSRTRTTRAPSHSTNSYSGWILR